MGPLPVITVVTAAAYRAASLEELKQQLEWDSDVNRDAAFDRYCAAAIEWYEAAANRTLVATVYDVAYDSFPGQGDDTRLESRRRASERLAIEIPRGPVLLDRSSGDEGVVSVKYRDVDNVLTTLGASAYELAQADPGLILPAHGTTWPTGKVRPAGVVVRVVCGYGEDEDDVPHAVRQLLRLLVAHQVEHREPILVGTIAEELPHSIRSLLWSTRAAPIAA